MRAFDEKKTLEIGLNDAHMTHTPRMRNTSSTQS